MAARLRALIGKVSTVMPPGPLTLTYPATLFVSPTSCARRNSVTPCGTAPHGPRRLSLAGALRARGGGGALSGTSGAFSGVLTALFRSFDIPAYYYAPVHCTTAQPSRTLAADDARASALA